MKKAIVLMLSLITITNVFANEEKIKVLTTLNILKSLAQEIGGDKVEVAALGTGHEDPHFIMLKGFYGGQADAWIKFIDKASDVKGRFYARLSRRRIYCASYFM